MNFYRTRPCKNQALDGSNLCGTHQPKPEPVRDEAKERYKTLMYVAGLRSRRAR
jgi:hypothetical protein